MVKFIFRAKRYGIGSAHKEGIFWAYDKKYESCITMDADRTHNPLEIKKLLTGLKKDKADIIITSRFIKKLPRGLASNKKIYYKNKILPCKNCFKY